MKFSVYIDQMNRQDENIVQKYGLKIHWSHERRESQRN